MATLETRDFIGMLDQYYPSQPHSSSSSSPLQFSLRVTESDCSNNAERVLQEEGSTADDAINDSSTTYKRKRSADQTFLHGYQNNISPLAALISPLLRDSMTPLNIPLARKASLARFFQKRIERVQNLRLNGPNSSSDRSARFLEANSERKNEAILIPAHITELELYSLSSSTKRQWSEAQ